MRSVSLNGRGERQLRLSDVKAMVLQMMFLQMRDQLR
jgi:hypothetical protein